ncbi:GFA family protein [Halocynthiibacter namhaensis]|uniref:GFA family protein n=1 Tax=Halocynthiibacter namhaensis TaxID=1290553 RepID=UPI0005792C50|nr:GFA family protein [Halocynthiibacter namhaensis]
MHKGSCQCGAVTYETSAELRPVVACHCTQCRKTSGHFWAATQVATDALIITNDAGLKWFRASETARRGFCQDCGSSLFWQMDSEPNTSIGAGTFDGETGLKTAKHIFVEDKGDYYDICCHAQQIDTY